MYILIKDTARVKIYLMFPNEGHKKDNSRLLDGKTHGLKSEACIVQYDKETDFFVEKAEKLTTALYMITNFLPTEEPFKWEIRKKSLTLLSFITDFSRTPLASEKEYITLKIVPSILEILSLLQFGLTVRFISRMNYSILRVEYNTLYDTICAKISHKDMADNLLFPDNFFNTDNGLSEGQNKEGTDKRHNNVLYDKRQSERVPLTPNPYTYRLNKNANTVLPKTGRKKTRQDTILSLLRTRGKLNIKDISDVISECSEKTIQRELSFLIHQGLVKKIGERRWSTYALN